MTHIGVVIPSSGQPNAAHAARAVENAGLDGVWTGDHLVWYGPFLDSTAQLAAAAAVTERVAIGWSVMLPALRPPVWAAKQVATVQQISGGRLQLGVGLGPPGPEWRAAGTSATGRAARTDAFLDALPDLLAGRPADPAGSGTPVTLEPAVQAPPLWIGGTSDAALRRVVRTGAGWLASLVPPDALAVRARELAAQREESRVATLVFVVPGSDDVSPIVDMVTSNYGLDRETAEACAFGGGAERLAEGFARYRDAGADTLVVAPFASDPIAAYGLLAEAREQLHGR